jgi:hypothetical protein
MRIGGMSGMRSAISGVPGLGPIKTGIDPLLSWLPGWAHSAVWAVIVYVVLLVLLTIAVRKVIPWIAEQLAQPVGMLINGVGIMCVLPEYVFTSSLRKLHRPAPAVAFGYSEVVRGVTGGVQRVASIVFAGLRALHRTPLLLLALVLVLLFLSWDGAYCVGSGRGCTVPTTQWVRSVSVAFAASQPTASKTAAKCTKKQRRMARREHRSCHAVSH